MLLETCVALFVAVCISIPVMTLMMTSATATNSARQNTIATNAARQALENVRVYKGGEIANGTYTDATIFGALPQLAELNNGSASLYISTYSGSSMVSTGVKLVSVTVVWTAGGNGSRRSQTLTTLITSGASTL
jgi:hypothetical protein